MRREELRTGRTRIFSLMVGHEYLPPTGKRDYGAKTGYEPALWNSGGVGGRAPGNAESMDF